MSAEERLEEAIARRLDEIGVENGFTLGFVERGEHRRIAPALVAALTPELLGNYLREKEGQEGAASAVGLVIDTSTASPCPAHPTSDCGCKPPIRRYVFADAPGPTFCSCGDPSCILDEPTT